MGLSSTTQRLLDHRLAKDLGRAQPTADSSLLQEEVVLSVSVSSDQRRRTSGVAFCIQAAKHGVAGGAVDQNGWHHKPSTIPSLFTTVEDAGAVVEV